RIEEKARRREERREERQRKRQERRERAGDDDDEDDVEETEEEESEGGESESDDDEIGMDGKEGYGRNRFGNAFQEVVDETGARVRIDSFEHCVVEVKKDDLSAFLESLSMRAVIG
ncbi:MAG: hypothetical protein Q9179_007997, partial [Wetmoreana sp. 5 TL-2023]